MNATIHDLQVVGETEGTLFESIQPSPIDTALILKNVGANPVSYKVQAYDGAAWATLGADGSDFQNTLGANAVKLIRISTNYPKIRLLGSASGGSTIDFQLTRHLTRASGGAVHVFGT